MAVTELDGKISWAEMPGLRKVGRYTFFLACAWGMSLTAGALAKGLGLNHDAVQMAGSLVGIVAFLTLRDMSKQWDWALEKRAQAIVADRATTPQETTR